MKTSVIFPHMSADCVYQSSFFVLHHLLISLMKLTPSLVSLDIVLIGGKNDLKHFSRSWKTNTKLQVRLVETASEMVGIKWGQKQMEYSFISRGSSDLLEPLSDEQWSVHKAERRCSWVLRCGKWVILEVCKLEICSLIAPVFPARRKILTASLESPRPQNMYTAARFSLIIWDWWKS